MKKRILSFLTMLCMVITLLPTNIIPVSAYKGTKHGDCLYYTVSDGEVTIADCDSSATTIEIPSTIDGYPVTSIGNYAFSHCNGLTSITVPDSVTSIGESAFAACENLKNITLPPNITKIDESTFLCCYNLESIVLPNKIKTIGYAAFEYCHNLAQITIPGSVTSIEKCAFEGCYGLKHVYISDLKSYMNIDFNDWTSIPTYYAHNLYLNNELLTDVIISEGVTKIPQHIFYHNTNIISVTIPATVTTIEEYAFSGCSSLTNITLSNNITTIGSKAFLECSALENLYICDLKSYMNINFNGKESIPTYYAHNLYLNNELLTDAVIPDRIEKISAYAFYRNTNIASITISKNVTDIDNYAFYGCTGLSDITIPDNIKNIGDSAFAGCKEITSVTLGKDIKYIGAGAFSVCDNIKKLYITDLNAYLTCEYGNSTSNPMYYAERLYINNKRATKVTVPEGIIQIPAYAFYRCDSITSVSLPEGVKIIGNDAFAYCSSLTNINLPESLVTINDYAFHHCSNLTSIVFPSNVTNIGRSAFEGCSKIESIIIPDNIKVIENETFAECTGLKNITIPNSVTSIKSVAFYKCYSLKNITLPDNLTTIEGSAFHSSGLTEIVIPDSVTSIGSWAFEYCGSLTNVTIGDGVKTIGSEAFYNCINLANLTLGTGITEIKERAFGNCNSLTGINITDVASWCKISFKDYYYNPLNGRALYLKGKLVENLIIPQNVSMINKYAFYGCNSLKSVTIPNTVTEIETNAFCSCPWISEIFYNGTDEDWEEIYIATGNNVITNSERKNSCSVKFTDVNNTEITINYFPGEKINLTDIEKKYMHKITLYTDEAMTKKFDTSTIVTGNMTLYVKLGEEIQGTKTTISADGTKFTVVPLNIANGNAVILSLYNGDTFVEIQSKPYTGEDIQFPTGKAYTSAKVMVWSNLESMTPICEPEIVK